MTKKSFRNPAKQFISNIDDTTIDNISKQQEEIQVHRSVEQNTVPMKRNPLFVETKSKRLQLLMQPSLHQSIKDRAIADNLSVNEYIHQALEKLIAEKS